MLGFTQSFSNLETKADALSAAQSNQAETQARLNGQMEIDMQVTQGYLSDVASKAMHLQATVTDALAKIQSMTAFARMFGSIFDWTVIFIAVALTIFGCLALRAVWRFSKVARWCAIVTTVILFAREVPSLVARLDIRVLTLPVVPCIDSKDPFQLASCAFCFTIGIGLAISAVRHRTRLAKRARSIPSYLSNPHFFGRPIRDTGDSTRKP